MKDATGLDPALLDAIVGAVLAELAGAGREPAAAKAEPATAAAASASAADAHDALERPIPALRIDSPKERGEAAVAPASPSVASANATTSAAAAARPYRRARHAGDGQPFAQAEVARLQALTPARVLQGRVGTRYPTDKAIGLRAEHAVALDAVHSVLAEGFAAALGCLELRTEAADHADYLAFPDKGRRLAPASRALLEQRGSRGADVQVICGDGLAAWALEANGPALLPALQQALTAAGFSVAAPLLVHHARVGVQDEIGVILGARATVILVGERPGLGTGDSLSIYTAFGPKMGQDNAEKDCISNIRPLGIPAEEAARMTAELLRRTFAAGGGGVHLTSRSDAA